MRQDVQLLQMSVNCICRLVLWDWISLKSSFFKTYIHSY